MGKASRSRLEAPGPKVEVDSRYAMHIDTHFRRTAACLVPYLSYHTPGTRHQSYHPLRHQSYLLVVLCHG